MGTRCGAQSLRPGGGSPRYGANRVPCITAQQREHVMSRLIDIWNAARLSAIAVAAAVLGWCASSGATPALANGFYIYDSSHYRPVHGRARNIFRNPVGKLSPGVTRRLPSLTPKPAEFDFGVAPITIDAPAGSAAKARRTTPALPVTPATPLAPDLSAPKKTL
jgi:hypothetical protein